MAERPVTNSLCAFPKKTAAMSIAALISAVMAPAALAEPVSTLPSWVASSDQDGAYPSLNQSFADDFSVYRKYEQWGQSLMLSRAGYPVIRSSKAVPVCTSPYDLTDALDAWRADDLSWLNAMVGCSLLPEGTLFEWTRESVGYRMEVIEVRVALPDGRRADLYAPRQSYGGNGVEDWMRGLSR